MSMMTGVQRNYYGHNNCLRGKWQCDLVHVFAVVYTPSRSHLRFFDSFVSALFVCLFFATHLKDQSHPWRTITPDAAGYRRAPREPVHYGLVDGSQQVQRCSSRLSKSFICGSDRSQSKRPQFSPWMRSVLRVWDLEVTNTPAAMTSRTSNNCCTFLDTLWNDNEALLQAPPQQCLGAFRVGQT